MSRRTRWFVIAVSTPLVVFVMVGGLLGAVLPAPQQGAEPLKVFQDVVRLINLAYVEPPSMDKVMDGAMKGLADSLDPATSYLTPEEVRAYEAKTPLPSADLGLTVTRGLWLRVIGVRDGSPAERAGIRSGDFIRAINDTATRDMSGYAGQRMLAGAPGSKVTLIMLRSSAADPHPVDLVREEPSAVRATGRRLPTGEAYVRVSSFGAGAVPAIRAAFQTLGTAAAGGVILDLRHVADGTPEDGIAAAKLFIAKGTLATRAGRSGDRTTVTAAAGDGGITVPLVVLVSRGTGQAAEVLAAALVGNKRAVLVGEPTAGLAAAQTLVKLPQGHGLLMTTTQYLQADGTPIHTGPSEQRGLRPEILVETPAAAFDQPPPATDPILTRGLEELKKRRG